MCHIQLNIGVMSAYLVQNPNTENNTAKIGPMNTAICKYKISKNIYFSDLKIDMAMA